MKNSDLDFGDTIDSMNKKLPDIVIIISDQQRYDTIPGQSRNESKTPHFKKLTEHGVTYRNSFCTTPICSPSRASILSGLYPHTHKLIANHQLRPGPDKMKLDPDIPLLPNHLEPLGYKCAYSGKWHLATRSDRRGFVDIHGKLGDHDVDRDDDNDFLQYAEKIGITLTKKKNGNQHDTSYYDSFRETGPSLFNLADHPSTFCCNQAVDFINRHADSNDPFCLVYSMHEPHPPFVCPTPFYGMHDPKDIVLPENYTKEIRNNWLDRNGTMLRSTSKYTKEDLKIMWAAYLDSISFVDHLTGRLLSALSDSEHYDNSLIIFTSDHGEMLGSHGMSHKGASLCEELIRTPLIIKYPFNENQNTICDDLISNIDILPTILDVCNKKPVFDIQGTSFYMPGAKRKNVVSEFHSSNWTDPAHPLRMWRTNKWKYIESAYGDNELYDLINDPYEMKNLYNDIKYESISNALRKELHEFIKASDDDFPNIPLTNLS